jgi:hypothetical protein
LLLCESFRRCEFWRDVCGHAELGNKLGTLPVPAPAARDAEYAEQRPRPTEAACWTSDALHAPTRQPVTRLWIFAWPEPHWQATSVRAQPEEEIADWRQGTCCSVRYVGIN